VHLDIAQSRGKGGQIFARNAFLIWKFVGDFVVAEALECFLNN
jgi:hypothetical protein